MQAIVDDDLMPNQHDSSEHDSDGHVDDLEHEMSLLSMHEYPIGTNLSHADISLLSAMHADSTGFVDNLQHDMSFLSTCDTISTNNDNYEGDQRSGNGTDDSKSDTSLESEEETTLPENMEHQHQAYYNPADFYFEEEDVDDNSSALSDQSQSSHDSDRHNHSQTGTPSDPGHSSAHDDLLLSVKRMLCFLSCATILILY
jgi:hypothetical protein